MLKPRNMKIADCTCLMCGSRLGLTVTGVVTGDNRGTCPMCSEPFLVNITREEMESFLEAEEEQPIKGSH